VPPANSPTVTITANPTQVTPGGASTLTVIATNANSVSISGNTANATYALPAAGGTQKVTPAATTTYTVTATGSGGTATAQTTVTVQTGAGPAVTITATPTQVAPGGSSTLIVSATNASQVVISNNVNNTTYTLAATGGTQSVTPTVTTTYKATATGTGGATATAQATVTVTGVNPGINSVSHIVIMMQENRSFDHYFGHLNEYRTSLGLPADVDDLSNAGNVSMPSWNNTGNISPYHLGTQCLGDLTPSWQEAHNMVNLTSPDEGKWGTPPPMNGFASMAGGFAQHDPATGGFDVAGKRALGYYTSDDLPFYYWAATTFATSDRWFSPALTRTQPNRMYFLAATSNGYAFPGGSGDPNHPALNMGTTKSIFQLLQENNVTWKVYVTDNYVAGDLTKMDTYENYFPWAFGFVNHFADATTFATDAANGTLPQVSVIESGYTESASDEHPQNPIDKGAQYTESMVQTLMNSPSWASSVFIITYDEGGGFFDHVPPISMPSPDGKKPFLAPGDPTGDFDTTGFRVPLMVISPFTKPGYVSHTNADYTAMLKFIETRFGLPPLNKRDAAQMDMTEFFDWTAPNVRSISPPKQPSLACYYDHLP
jgi:phospholipase C